MDLELAGRTAVVIGGSSGIGAAVAGVLAEEGCGHGRWAWVVPLELGAPESAAGAAETLADQVGGLDVVVLCAGNKVVTPFGRISAEEWACGPRDQPQRRLLRLAGAGAAGATRGGRTIPVLPDM